MDSSSSSSTSASFVVRSGRTTEKRGGGSETRSRGGTNKELTEDLVVEILARLPVKSLLRFKSVSKGWYSLIISPNFISKHTTHHSRNTVVLFRRYSCIHTVTDDYYDVGGRSTTTTLSFLFDENRVEQVKFVYHSKWMPNVKMVGGCLNGVVCFSLSREPPTYALWNPATRQVRLLPPDRNSQPFYTGSGFCFDPGTNSFKVVRVSIGGEIGARVNVFSTATNSWTLREVARPYPINSFRPAEFVNGYMHWHIWWELQERYILRYNITDEVFQRLELPSPRRHASVSEYYHLSDYKGSLAMFVCVSSYISSEVDVWLLNDSGGGANHSCWSKLLSFKPSVSNTSVVGFFRKDEAEFIILRHPEPSFYLYDTQNGETKKYRNEEHLWETLPYSESLASLD